MLSVIARSVSDAAISIIKIASPHFISARNDKID
jgi:hypothetical protein